MIYSDGWSLRLAASSIISDGPMQCIVVPRLRTLPTVQDLTDPVRRLGSREDALRPIRFLDCKRVEYIAIQIIPAKGFAP